MVGIIWQRGGAAASKAARDQHHSDELAALATNVAKIDLLERRIVVLEGQQNLVASRIDAINVTLVTLRTEMVSGFDRMNTRQDRMIETMSNAKAT